MSQSQPVQIRAAELQRKLTQGEPIQLVDVREDTELDLARLSYPVIHLPLSRLHEWMETIDSKLNRHHPVAVLCHAGVRSWHMACWLVEQRGFQQVWNLQGGIDAWSLEADPEIPRY